MADNKLYNNQDVYVETSYDNIVVVDPNKVLNSDKTVSERLVNHEELVMYASLEAKVIPRSKLVVGDNYNDTIQNIRVGKIENDKETNINFMKTQSKNKDGEIVEENFFDTSWTDNLTLGRTKNGDVDSQLLGITNINIRINTSFAALVTIEMEDVQGRVLFEQGENSPYSAFFQFPYPLFTLTVKGYFGKALRYELMLKDFNAKFDPASGNYKITTNYISRTYALLSDISIDYLYALPHMYHVTTEFGTDITTNESGGVGSTEPIVTIPSTRGFDMIKNVYSSYKQKGLIDENFPELTINQMIMKLENFDRFVMEAYGQQDMTILNDTKSYYSTIQDFRNAIFGNITENWSSEYIDTNSPVVIKNKPIIYPFKKDLGANTDRISNIRKAISKLSSIIEKYNTNLNENPTYGEEGECEINGEIISNSLSSKIKTDNLLFELTNPTEEVDFEETFILRNRKTPTEQELTEFKAKFIIDFQKNSFYIDKKTLQVQENTEEKTYVTFGSNNVTKDLSQNSFLQLLQDLEGRFNSRKLIVEEKLTQALSEKIKSPDVGLGFNPTIKNVMAVICASADAFLRLMDKVHEDAWEKRKDPIRVGAIVPPEKSQGIEATGVKDLLSDLSNYTPNQEGQPTIFPWPQYFVQSTDEEGNTQFEDKYPGDPSVISQIQGWRSDVWPEIKFVEEYIKGSTQKDEQVLNFDYENVLKDNPFLGINAIEFPNQQRPYTDLNVISYMYELFERTYLGSNYTKLYRSSGYENEIYSVLGDFEFNNMNQSVSTSTELIDLFKNFSFSFENMLKYMRNISNNGEGQYWNLFKRGFFATPYIKELLEKDFGLYDMSYMNGDSTKVESQTKSVEKLKNYLENNSSNELTFTDGYPFNNLSWIQKNISKGNEISSVFKSNDTTKMFSFNEYKKTISSFSLDDKLNEKKLFSYFDWRNNGPSTYVEENFVNSPTSQITTNLQAKDYYENKKTKNLQLTESHLDYGNKYDTTVNNLTKTQTTSLLNTPYFINALLKGVENEKTNIENPYTALGYLYLNSLPLSTLREKYKSFNGEVETELDYIFATLNKYASIHKIPQLWIAKYGAIWHRYKRFKNENVDILDDVWQDFDYVNAYDPDNGDITKKYKFNNYDGEDVEIQQFDTYTTQAEIDLGDNYINQQQYFDTITFDVTTIQNGFYPKVINDTYFYLTKTDLFSAYTSSEIQKAQTEKNLKIGNTSEGTIINTEPDLEFKMNSWTQFLEVKGNTDFQENLEDKVMIVPSFGHVKFNQVKYECFNTNGVSTQNLTTNNSIYNGGVRSLWGSSNYGYFSNDYVDKPSPEEYIKYIDPNTNNKQPFNMGNSTTVKYSSIEDIFGVFTKDMLDNFEQVFLNFCEVTSKFDVNLINRGQTTFEEFINSDEVKSQYEDRIVPETDYLRWKSVYENKTSTYSRLTESEKINLHVILNSLFLTDKPSLTGDIDDDILEISNNQSNTFSSSHKNVLYKDSVLKIGNPGKFNNRVYGSVTSNEIYEIYDKIDFGYYVPNTLPISGGTVTLSNSVSLNPEAWNAMYMYVGDFREDNLKYSDNGSYLTDFFVDMDYKFTENNVKLLSNIIKIYAGYKANNPNITKDEFLNELNNYLGEQNKFQESILNHVFINANKKLKSVAITEDNTKISKLDGNIIKLELWKTFQAMNDKWVGGQDFKTRTIFEDFLFLDRANRPVGDKIVINIEDFIGVIRGRTNKTSLYGLVGAIYKSNNFTFIPTPAYTNFYGRNERVKTGEPIPQDIPNDIFGTFMEVDVRDSRPRMLGIYAGQPSSNLEMGQNETVKYGDDSFDITNPSTCPLRENQDNKTNFSDSNACVGFQVDFGKRNQGVFNSISIDMDQHRNIGPTFEVLADLGSQTSGQKVAQQSQSFYQFYKTRSYTCNVQSMGNAMIQPTMYFNLTNVPMFYGPYLIMNVSHNISNRGFVTNFDGIRIPKNSLEFPDKLVASVNRELLEKYGERLSVQKTGGLTGGSVNNILLTKTDKVLQATEVKCKAVTKYNQKPFVDLTTTNVKSNDVATYLNSKNNLDGNIKIFIYGIATLNKDVRQNCYNNNLVALTTKEELKPQNRSELFNAQTCIDNNGVIFPIASFDSINKCMDYMIATYGPYGGRWVEELKEIIQPTTTLDPTPKALSVLYMAQIYDKEPLGVGMTPQQVYEIVKQKSQTNTEYKKEKDSWENIFKSVLHKIS